jgi:hypothetical protein
VAANLLGQRPVGRAAEELEALVFAQVAGPLALGRRLGVFALASGSERPGGSFGVPSGCAFGLRCRVALSSNVNVTVPVSISDFPPSWLALAVFGA